MTGSGRGGPSLKRTAIEFARNLAVTFSLPVVDMARLLGAVNLPRPVAPKLRALTENPAGRSLSALAVRGVRRLMGNPLGAPSPLLKELARIAASGRPIVVGPWLSEVGFELLYWIPFLQWAMEEHRVDPGRVLVVSRGGVAGWYGNIGGRYADMLDVFGPDEFRQLNERRIEVSGHQKHMEIGEVDRIILDRVCAAAGVVGEYEVLHPSLMYQLLLPLWQRRAPARLAHNHARYRRLASHADIQIGIDLPERYTAAKFYFSDAFPATEQNVGKVRAILTAYLRRGPVVLLTAGIQIDDHRDVLEGLPPGLVVYTPSDPTRNLAVQTAVVERAERFIGTYGGFSYLAPLLGVPSLCVYSDAGRLMPMHMDVAFRIFRNFSCGSLEKGCTPGSVGAMPAARFSALHVDALQDLAGFLAES